MVVRAQRLNTRCVSTSGIRARCSNNLIPNGAPVAPVIPTISLMMVTSSRRVRPSGDRMKANFLVELVITLCRRRRSSQGPRRHRIVKNGHLFRGGEGIEQPDEHHRSTV